MICRSICLASLLLLVAVSSADAAIWVKQTFYKDENCTTPNGAFLYGYSSNGTAQQCAENAGNCTLQGEQISVLVTCLNADPLLNLPSDHIAAVAYLNYTDCIGTNNYQQAISGPINTCVAATSLFGYFKATGCAGTQPVTGTFYETAEDCANNKNGTTYSYPANECHNFNDAIFFKFICPPSAPVAVPVASTPVVSAPVATPNKKASTAASFASVGLISFASAWIVTLV